MKSFIFILFFLVLFSVSSFAQSFAIRTNQPAIGTNTVPMLIASNLFVYRSVWFSNIVWRVTGSSNYIDGHTIFTGTNTFNDGSTIFNTSNYFNGATFFSNSVSITNATLTLNASNLNILDGLNMSVTYTNMFLTNGTFAGRTNTMYFTNGILVRLTTP